MVWGVVRQLLAGLACMLLVGGASGAAAVSGEVVLGDAYPPRRIGFPGGVTGFPDLVYETVPGFRPLHLDLYRPADGPDKTLHPFVVYVHGGGWMGGHTRQSGAFTRWPDVLAALAARGYVVASVEYRLSSEARFPAAQQDVKAAIRWLRSQASTYHIDKTRGLIWGASAGGQLAALTATSCGVATLDPVGAPAESDCVQGAVAWYGIFDFSTFGAQDNPDSAGTKYLGCQASKCAPGVVSAASPVTYIKRDSPPMLLIHGSADKTVPVQQSQEMYDKLHAAGAPVQLLLIPDVDHSFIGKTPADTEKASRTALARVFDFIDTTIGTRGAK
jgi:acetyl esterase/lipase